MILALLFAAQLPSIHLSLSPFASQYGAIRSMEESKERPSQPGLQAAVSDLAKLEASFPARIRTRSGDVIEAKSVGQAKVNELYWRTLDALTFSSGSPEDLSDVADAIPTIGGELDSSVAVKAIQKALSESKVEYDQSLWSDAKKIAQGCLDSFSAVPAARIDGALQFILSAAAITKAPKRIDILVISRMAGKEGMTVRTPSGTLIVIGAGKYRGFDFAEVVLHEATHVLDTTAGADSLFGKLRSALKAAGRPAFEVEQVPHVAMFLLAASAVRQNLDPHHRDVGATFGAYGRGLDPLRKVVEPVLTRLVVKQIGTDEAVGEIVAHLK